MHDTFGSTCHDAGRAMSRVKARQAAVGRNIIREMEKKGIIVRGQSRRTVDEEISESRALFVHRHGEIRDRTFENQRYRAPVSTSRSPSSSSGTPSTSPTPSPSFGPSRNSAR